MPLTVRHRRHQDLAVVVLTGEVDVAASAQLRESLVRLVASGVRHLILDLRAVAFIDSNGLSVLLSIHRHLHGSQGSVVLAGANRHIRDVLRVTQLTRIFPIYGTADVAFQAHQATHTGDGHGVPAQPAPDHDRQTD